MTGQIDAHASATLLRLGADGRIAAWPDSARDMFGRCGETVVGERLCTLIASACACARVIARLSGAAAEEIIHTEELTAQRGDGSTFQVECSLWRAADDRSGSPVIQAFIREIVDRTGVEQDLRRELRELRECSAGQLEQLRTTQALFADITETISEVFWMADAAISRMLYVSPAYERIWGRSCQSLYDDPRSFLESIHPDDYERVLQNLVVQRSGLPFDHEYRILRPDGTTVWVWDRGYPIRNPDGTVERYVGVAQDISARKLAEASVVRQETLDAIGQMSGGLAHDFNNVLGVVIGHLDLLALALPAGAETRESVDLALDAALRGSRLARRLLALARREPLQRRVINLGDAIEALLPLLQHAVGAETQVVDRIAARPLVSVDTAELDGALINMAVNARAAMPDGGLLTVAVDEFDMPGQTADYSVPPGRYAVLTVSDTGCGMDEGVLRRLGEPFFSTRRAAQGTGLGVAMVHAFARQSGGAVHVQSAPGAGSTFTVLLPIVVGVPGDVDGSARGTIPT